MMAASEIKGQLARVRCRSRRQFLTIFRMLMSPSCWRRNAQSPNNQLSKGTKHSDITWSISWNWSLFVFHHKSLLLVFESGPMTSRSRTSDFVFTSQTFRKCIHYQHYLLSLVHHTYIDSLQTIYQPKISILRKGAAHFIVISKFMDTTLIWTKLYTYAVYWPSCNHVGRGFPHDSNWRTRSPCWSQISEQGMQLFMTIWSGKEVGAMQTNVM